MPNKSLTRLLFVQGGLCFFCNGPLPATEASVEHLVAKANGGGDLDRNCVACCKSLNALLGSMSLKEKVQVVLNQKKPFECPNGVQRKITKAVRKPSPKVTKFPPEYYERLVANLKQRGSSKPGNIKTLKTTIAGLFQNKVSKGQVDALVQELRSRGEITIANSKVTYFLGGPTATT